MKNYRIFFVSILLLSQTFIKAQPANTCPVNNAGPDQTVCGGCVNLTQTFLPVNATTAYTVASTPYLPYSYTSGTTAIPTSTDDIWSPVINIGFCFQFYGNTYTQCIIGSNGAIGFNLANASAYNTWPDDLS